mgnify:CR=1 FL=1
MNRVVLLRHLLATAVVPALMITTAARRAEAARIHHKDGTTVEGKIVHETPDQIRIATAYGTLNYPKEDLTRIERDGPAAGGPTPRVNYTAAIPAGPVNPSNPPQVPPLVRFSSPATPQTTTALPGLLPASRIPTPVVPVIPAGPVTQGPTATMRATVPSPSGR